MASAGAQVQESVTYTNVNSNGPVGNAVNEVRTYSASGGYTMRSMRIAGTLTRINSASYASEARIRITAPNGAFTDFQMFTQTSFTTLTGEGRVYTAPFTPQETRPFGFMNRLTMAEQAVWTLNGIVSPSSIVRIPPRCTTSALSTRQEPIR